MIRVVDYGLGNVSAFLAVYRGLNIEAGAARDPDDLKDARKLILPGVGAFDQAMRLLDGSGMRASLDALVQEKKLPVLGVCIGMQMLGLTSEEGRVAGLGWMDARVRKLSAKPGHRLVLPHMGWNDVQPVSSCALFAHVAPGARFYFLHSYYLDCARAGDVAALAYYGQDFPCAVQADNVYGVQFHPEKSHQDGAQLLKNFAELAC